MPSPTTHSGDIGETDFLAKATKKGFRVSQPYGKDYPYDSILDNGLIRFLMQIKSTAYLAREDVYLARCGRPIGTYPKKIVPYLESEVDFVSIYVIPEDSWTHIPIGALRGRTSIYIYSRHHKKQGEWEPFRENWDLFRQHQTPAVAELMRKIREKALKG